MASVDTPKVGAGGKCSWQDFNTSRRDGFHLTQCVKIKFHAIKTIILACGNDAFNYANEK